MTDEEMAEEWLDKRYLKDMGVRKPCKQAFLAGLKAGEAKAKKEIEAELLKCYQGYPEKGVEYERN